MIIVSIIISWFFDYSWVSLRIRDTILFLKVPNNLNAYSLKTINIVTVSTKYIVLFTKKITFCRPRRVQSHEHVQVQCKFMVLMSLHYAATRFMWPNISHLLLSIFARHSGSIAVQLHFPGKTIGIRQIGCDIISGSIWSYRSPTPITSLDRSR